MFYKFNRAFAWENHIATLSSCYLAYQLLNVSPNATAKPMVKIPPMTPTRFLGPCTASSSPLLSSPQFWVGIRRSSVWITWVSWHDGVCDCCMFVSARSLGLAESCGLDSKICRTLSLSMVTSSCTSALPSLDRKHTLSQQVWSLKCQ